MRKIYILIMVIALGGAAFVFWPRISNAPSGVEPVLCTMEAKLCPDGSYVGRSGPRCEFTKCPAATSPEVIASAGDLTLRVGQKGKVGDLSLTLNKIVSDSRCPKYTVCVWAGTVNLSVTLSDASGSETRNMSLNEAPYLFDGHLVSVTSAMPTRDSQKEILAGDYKITFHISVDNKPSANEALVKGVVTLSPTCPVERIPPDPACAPKPYQTSIEIFTLDGTELVKTVQSGSDGSFTFTLPFGDYNLETSGGNVYPRCAPVSLSLKTPNPSPINISCDTGIR